MSETTPPTPPTSGRVRRRASRQAGPVGDQDRTAATETVVKSAPVPVDAAPEPEVSAAGNAAGLVRDGGTGAAIAAASSAKTAVAEDVPTAKLRRSGAEVAGGPDKAATAATFGSDPVDADATGKIAASEADSTVKLDTAGTDAAGSPGVSDAGGGPGASGAEPVDAPVDVPVDAPDTRSELVPEEGGFLRSMRPIEWAAAVVAIVALLGLLGGGGAYLYHQSHADAVASQRAEYVQTAKQAILNLTNIKDDTASQDIDRVLAVASGDLKAEYSQRKDAYAQVVKEAKVKASGEVIEAAIESQNDDSAKVLVAAEQTLTNAGDSQPQDRYYRFRVTVNRGDGGVTASKVEFVA